MKFYVAHSSSIDYKNDLYKPIRESKLNKQHEIILPHEHSAEMYDSKKGLKSCDLIIAEVTHHSTSMGIELGWADLYKVPIIAVYKKGNIPTQSLSAVTNKILEYDNNLIEVLEKLISEPEVK